MMADYMPASEYDLFKRASAAWGLDYVHTARVLPCETLRHPNGSEVELFQLNGRWGYSLSVQCHARNGVLGFAYSSYLKWCKPYLDRQAALAAAATEIQERAAGDDEISAWCNRLFTEAQQLRLF
jgi:hypothetical protein